MYLKSGADDDKEATFHDDAALLEDACTAKIAPKVERWCRCPGWKHPYKMKAKKDSDGEDVMITPPGCPGTPYVDMENVVLKDDDGADVLNKNGEPVWELDYDEDKI